MRVLWVVLLVVLLVGLLVVLLVEEWRGGVGRVTGHGCTRGCLLDDRSRADTAFSGTYSKYY